MASPEHVDEAQRAIEVSGPGQLLRRARESRGIALHDIAAQLHLDARTIAALERDAFDELPAPTFVRGYLRGYARLLNVPAGPVMDAYNQEGFHPPDLVADIAEKPQAASGDLPVRMLTYAIVVVLAALVIWWWYDRERSSGVDSTAAVTPPSTIGSDGVLRLPAPSSLPKSDGPVSDPPAPPPAAAISSATSESAPPRRASATLSKKGSAPRGAPAARTPSDAADSSQTRVEQALARVDRTLAATEDMAASEAVPAPVRSTPAVAAAAALANSETTGAAAAPAKATIRLDFPVEAWVEVYAKDNERLFFNLVKPGRTLELTGLPPIRMVLGRTRGVTLSYNGEAVDLTPHIRKGGVAQLTLGQ